MAWALFLLYRRSYTLAGAAVFQPPHFLFLCLAKEKENAPLAVEKKKKTLWVLIDKLVRFSGCPA